SPGGVSATAGRASGAADGASGATADDPPPHAASLNQANQATEHPSPRDQETSLSRMIRLRDSGALPIPRASPVPLIGVAETSRQPLVRRPFRTCRLEFSSS